MLRVPQNPSFVLWLSQGAGPLYGAYMGGKGELPGAGPISIGLYELKLRAKAT